MSDVMAHPPVLLLMLLFHHGPHPLLQSIGGGVSWPCFRGIHSTVVRGNRRNVGTVQYTTVQHRQ